MKSNILELKGLSVARDGVTLIPPFDYRLESSDLLVVKGPNGSGKSSLLKCLAGLLPPAAGKVLLNGKAPGESGPILYLGHQLGLSLPMSVVHNVALWAELYGQPELTAAALHYFDLGDIADLPARQLSAGWRQRVALTRLITVPGLLWLLDEPTGHLDEEGMKLLHSLLQTRLEQGGMIAMTTHTGIEGERIKLLDLSLLNPFVHVGGQC